VTDIVVEVGPTTVRGPDTTEAEWVSAGIDGIDDELTLMDDRPLAVADVWRTVMNDVAGGSAETIVLVFPTWWATSRVECVRDAASSVATDVVVLRRAEALREGLPDRLATVVEIAPEFMVVSSPEGGIHVVDRDDAAVVVEKIPMSTTVVLDTVEGVPGALPLTTAIADRLRANGVAVTIADQHWVRRSLETRPSQLEIRRPQARPSTKRSRQATAILAGTLLSAAVLAGGFATRPDVQRSADEMPMTLLVEGRVGVMVPAQWVVHRVTAGPGSARVQVVSTTDADLAMHITQSSLGPHSSHEAVVASLRSALSQQPDGVFVDFDPSGRRADRPVVTYREVRADHHIEWAVLTDESLRIAIGCQSAPGHPDAVRAACDHAIRSAHAVF
jgi:type VII secretion-associated protein (TIGR03931 family)